MNHAISNPMNGIHGMASMLQQRFHGSHVLVVDDEHDDLVVEKTLLESASLEVDTAGDGSSAMAKACNHNYAAVLIHVQMSDVDGLEATRQIRTVPGYQHVPIIALTATAFAEDKARCYEAGLNDIVVKPFAPDALFDTLFRWLSQKQGDYSIKLATLTLRERQILECVVDGQSNKTIARELGISHKTVETHRSHMMRKMGAASLAELQQQVLKHAQSARFLGAPHPEG
ncbi:MAG: response regulator [Betaproteobacteria bacterium]|nr:response regulator [Betaproteobacteria bacterium]